MNTEARFNERKAAPEGKRAGRPGVHAGVEPAVWIEAGALMSLPADVARERLMREARPDVLRLVAEHDARNLVRARARARLRVIGEALTVPKEEAVLWTCTNPACGHVGPPDDFGMRRMGNGKVRRQVWCRPCRSEAAKRSRAKKKAETTKVDPAEAEVQEWVQAMNTPTVLRFQSRKAKG